MKSNLDQSLSELALLLRPVVVAIHEQQATTKDYYGEYMSAISIVADKDKSGSSRAKLYLGVAVAMQRAGANHQGVVSALKAMGVI